MAKAINPEWEVYTAYSCPRHYYVLDRTNRELFAGTYHDTYTWLRGYRDAMNVIKYGGYL